jgi:hypothetical protein
LEREELLNLIKQSISNSHPEQGLRIYGIQQPSLKEFKISSKNGVAFDVEPASKFRLLDEELKPNNGDDHVEDQEE